MKHRNTHHTSLSHHTLQHVAMLLLDAATMHGTILVGFLPFVNGCSGDSHPFECGNLLMLEREDHGVGIYLSFHLLLTLPLPIHLQWNCSKSPISPICFLYLSPYNDMFSDSGNTMALGQHYEMPLH